MPRKRKIPGPDGQLADATLIDIKEVIERFSDVMLDDGTHIRVRMIIREVLRYDTLWADDGEPMYSVQNAAIPMVVEAPDVLKKPPTGRKDN